MEEKVIIPSTTGSDLHGIIYTIKDAQYGKNIENPPIIILCHGYTGDKYEWGRFPETALACNKEGIDALIFDFSGSGENKRVPIRLYNQFKDLESVHKWVQNRGYKRIAVLGLSFGGLTALGANLPGIITYVFWAPFFFLHTTEERTDEFKDLDKGPVEIPSSGEGDPVIIEMSFITDFAKFRVRSFLKKLDHPTLIIQGTADEDVPVEFSRKAFNFLPKANDNKLIEIHNATHDFEGEHSKEFIKHTVAWVKNHLIIKLD
jgi:dipeptidyl aminopeptidase/acylaminoacyl peptidase